MGKAKIYASSAMALASSGVTELVEDEQPDMGMMKTRKNSGSSRRTFFNENICIAPFNLILSHTASGRA
jgi:hypothetical protein